MLKHRFSGCFVLFPLPLLLSPFRSRVNVKFSQSLRFPRPLPLAQRGTRQLSSILNSGVGFGEVDDFRAQDFPTRGAHRGDD